MAALRWCILVAAASCVLGTATVQPRQKLGGSRGVERVSLGASPFVRGAACAGSLATVVAPSVAAPAGKNMVQEQMGKIGTYFSEGIDRCKLGATGLWSNWGKVREIRAKEKKGEKIGLNEHLTLQRDRADSTKLLHMLAVYALSPNLLPYFIIFYGRALPSTFDLDKDVQKRWRDMKHSRIAGCLTTLMEVEKGTINDKDPRMALKGAQDKALVKRALEAPTWQAAVQELGPGLVYNATKLKVGEKRKADLGGVPPAAIKGANMAIGAPLNFLPAFLLKFQVKAALFNMAATDEFISKAGAQEALPTMCRKDLVQFCMDRCIGDPALSDEDLIKSAKTWLKETEAIPSIIKEADPENNILVCPYRSRLALLGIHSIESARTTEGGGCLTRALYAGKNKVKLGY